MYGGYESQKEADKRGDGRRLFNRLAQTCWVLVPHANAAGFKTHAGDMRQQCPVFLEAAQAICAQQSKHPQLSQDKCTEIRDMLNYWIEFLPPSSTMKLKVQIVALRDMVAKHGKYLEASNATRNNNHNRAVGDKVTDSRNYVVAPCKDSVWGSFTDGDRAAAARINTRLGDTWCPDYDLFRIDDMLLTEEEKAHCATTSNPDQLKYDRFHRLFPTEKCKGGPFIKRLHVYRYAAGATIGGMWNFVAPLPPARAGDSDPTSPSAEELTQMVRAVTFLKEKQIVPRYVPRAVMRAFKDRYCKNVDGLSASALSELVAHVCGDQSEGSHGDADKARRARIELFLDQDEEDVEDIIVDLRRHNGNSEVYTKFYKITAEFLDAEVTKVDARRHQALSAVPPAWSVSNLIYKIKEFAAAKALCPIAGATNAEIANSYLLTEDDIPSEQWVRMCFCPSNPWLKSSAAYQCRFDLQFNLLSRTAHHEHVDSEYAARVFKHLRELACELKALGIRIAFIFADDKCSAKVGELGDAVAAVERNKRVIGNNELRAIASRHDFAKFKVNPSVILLLAGSDIPDSVLESFYRGLVFVSVKDAVFQPSSPWRHSAEILKVLKSAEVLDELQVLLLYTDGGPDHNITFMTVIASLLCLFLTGDLDFVIAARTCPQQSWKNCVEKIMCILNLAMYGVALVREEMPEEMEDKCKAAKKSMAGVRAASKEWQAEHPEEPFKFQDACMDAVAPARRLLSSRYEELSLKGQRFQSFMPASKCEMLNMISCLAVVDSTFPQDESALGLKTAALRKCNGLKKCIEMHCIERAYCVSIGKLCWKYDQATDTWERDSGCKSCKQPTIAGPVFNQLSARRPLNPDPEPTRAEGNEWAKYAELAAKGNTTEQYRPSINTTKKRAKVGEGQSGLKDQYIRSFAKCSNCPKLFLLYAAQCPTPADVEAFQSVTSDISTCCGKLPLPPNHDLHRLGLQVNHNNSCAGPMEEQYYSKKIPKTQCFPQLPWPLLCFHCGSNDEVLPVYLCICASVYLCICASVYLCICVSVHLCICASVHLCICASVYLCICASVYMCICVSVHLCICVSVCLCICVQTQLLMTHPK